MFAHAAKLPMPLIIRSCWFQCLWCIAVIGRESWDAILMALLFGTLLVERFYFNSKLRGLMLFIPCVLVDYLFYRMQLFQFNANSFPLWLALLWLAFIWYFIQLAPILNKYPLLVQALLGALTGPLSYWAAVLVGAVEWPLGFSYTFMILVCWWGLLVPCLVGVLNNRLSGNYQS
jgi:hypothetical protein